LLELQLVGHGCFWIVPAGGIDQDRGRAKSGFDLFAGLEEAFTVKDVGREKPGFSFGLADALHASFAAAGITAKHGDFRADLGQALSHRTTQDAGGANHDGHIFRQIKHHAGRHD